MSITKSAAFGYKLEKCVTPLDINSELTSTITSKEKPFPLLQDTQKICYGVYKKDEFILMSNGKKERLVYKNGTVSEMEITHPLKTLAISLGAVPFGGFDTIKDAIRRK